MFGALIEFAVIIVLKRGGRNTKISPNEDTKKKVHPINDRNQNRQKFNALSVKIKQLKIDKLLSDIKEEKENEKSNGDSQLFKKIDFHSFIAYFVGYCLFNFFYWIDMLLY